VARRFRCGLAESGPFVCRCLISLTMPRFHTPAYRTGQAQLTHPALGESVTLSPTENCGSRCKSNQAKLLMQGLLGKPRIPSSPLFVFDTQPLAKPPARRLLHGSVGVTDRTPAEVVSPTINLPVERCYQRCRIRLGLTPAGHLADRLTQTLHSNFSSGSRQTRVLLSFTVNFSFNIMFRIRTSASSARPRQLNTCGGY
jgi:hypothetical protein